MNAIEERESQERIRAIQNQWRDAVHATPLLPDEAIRAAAEWLVVVIMSMASEERVAHEILNRTIEPSHEYINGNWRDSRISLEKEIAKEARR